MEAFFISDLNLIKKAFKYDLPAIIMSRLIYSFCEWKGRYDKSLVGYLSNLIKI
jgi:hypothetical protein